MSSLEGGWQCQLVTLTGQCEDKWKKSNGLYSSEGQVHMNRLVCAPRWRVLLAPRHLLQLRAHGLGLESMDGISLHL